MTSVSLQSPPSPSSYSYEEEIRYSLYSFSIPFFYSDSNIISSSAPSSSLQRLGQYFCRLSLMQKVSLRAHKFTFQWSLVLHFLICIVSLLPFAFTGQRDFAILPICIWVFYNVLFFFGSRYLIFPFFLLSCNDSVPRHPNKIVSGFLKLRNTFKLSMEEVICVLERAQKGTDYLTFFRYFLSNFFHFCLFLSSLWRW